MLAGVSLMSLLLQVEVDAEGSDERAVDDEPPVTASPTAQDAAGQETSVQNEAENQEQV